MSPRANDQYERDRSSSPKDRDGSPPSWSTVNRGRSRTRNTVAANEPESVRSGYHSLNSSFGKVFHVEKRWKIIREMGSGAYGYVVSAADEITKEVVAIKLVTRVAERIQLAKRALREITLLRHFAHHENITGLIDADALSPDLTEIYIFMEPMEADLHQIIKSGQALTNEHIQYFVYQILKGMKYVHSASVVHRDLKPGNLLVNANCELKICDFGLSRGFDSTPEHGSIMTEYVATRWYRAPEIMLAFKRYDTAIDVWSIGCIFAELLLGRPIFKGKDYVDQLNKIIDILGTPSDETINRIGSEKAQAYVRSLPIRNKVSFKKLIPTADVQGVGLLRQMLSFDPTDRITVRDALEHPWLSTYHNKDEEPECTTVFNRWREIEELNTLEEFKKALWDEIQDYRREVRALDTSVSPSSIQRTNTATSVLDPYALGQIAEEEPRESSASPPADSVPNEGEGDEKVPVRNESLTAPSDTGSMLSTTPTDPVVTYARRASIMQSASSPGSTSGQSSTPASRRSTVQDLGYFTDDPGQGKYRNTIAFPTESYILLRRSRTASLYGGEVPASKRLLRTLSTVSIHESGKGLANGLADIAPIGKYIVERNTADEPASEMPGEFGDEEVPQ